MSPLFILVVCSAPCVYSLVCISNITIPLGNAEKSHILITSFGFKMGFLLFLQWVLHVETGPGAASPATFGRSCEVQSMGRM